jgi:hypothetical protein
MSAATKKFAKEIAKDFDRLEKLPPDGQMAALFQIGGEFRRAHISGKRFGSSEISEIVRYEPRLKNAQHVFDLTVWAAQDDEFKNFIIEQTAIPMSNGKHLTFAHWKWLLSYEQFFEESMGEEKWKLAELAWLRKEALSEAVIEHIEVFRKRERVKKREKIEEIEMAMGDLVHSLMDSDYVLTYRSLVTLDD